MKKLVTVAWSVAIEVEEPEGVHLEDLVDADLILYKPKGKEVSDIMKEAWSQVQYSYGMITDVATIPE